MQHYIAPAGAPALHVGAIDEVADADHSADAVEGETPEMVDEVFAGKGLLRHRAGGDVLKSEMAVEVDQRGHHGLAGEIDVSGACGHLRIAAAADQGEMSVLDDEGRILDHGAVASDQACAFIDCGGCLRLGRLYERDGEDEGGQKEQPDGHQLRPRHGDLPFRRS